MKLKVLRAVKEEGPPRVRYNTLGTILCHNTDTECGHFNQAQGRNYKVPERGDGDGNPEIRKSMKRAREI